MAASERNLRVPIDSVISIDDIEKAHERMSEAKKEILRFSSETANLKKRDGILHLAGEVRISYGQYVIKSDFLIKSNFISSNGVIIVTLLVL